MYATNGFNLNKSCFQCSMLLVKIAVQEKNYDGAIEFILKEPKFYDKTLNNTKKMEIYQQLFEIYLTRNKQNEYIDFCNKLNIFDLTTNYILMCKYFSDNKLIDELEESSQKLVTINHTIGTYFIGMKNYNKILISISSGSYNTKEMLELISVTTTLFENIMKENCKESYFVTIKNNIEKILKYLNTFSDKLN